MRASQLIFLSVLVSSSELPQRATTLRCNVSHSWECRLLDFRLHLGELSKLPGAIVLGIKPHSIVYFAIQCGHFFN